MKRSNFEPADRLSDLPDSLILKIFEFLPTRDVVCTQILSSRWKTLWTINPCLYFDHSETYSSDNDYHDDFRNFVNRALLSWRGTRVHKFKVSGDSLYESLFNELYLWVRFAVDNRVEELDIWFSYAKYETYEEDYCVPKCLYSCSSLQKLSLNCFSLEIKGNVQWSRLKNLKIECYTVTQHDIDQMLCGSPLLEVFILDFQDLESDLDLSFRSCSLKELSIKMIYGRKKPTALRIWTPNLVMLTISEVPFNDCLLMNVSSLARANLLFHGRSFRGETLSQIIPAIQRVEGLSLSDSCAAALGAMNIKTSLSPFLNVKFLGLTYRFENNERIVSLVELFPKLNELAVEDIYEYATTPKSKAKFKPNPSKTFLVELKTVEITWTGHNFLIFPFIKILLKYASKLEKMVFRVRQTGPSANLLLAAKKLLRMPRSSPSAKLVFLDYEYGSYQVVYST